jgi:hypothetical protein
MQDPYQPFENDQLTWSAADSETGSVVMSPREEADIRLRDRPTLLLFVTGADADSCCAANYERFIFRDRNVLRLAEEFLTLRVNRAQLDDLTREQFTLDPERPALVLLDNEGLVVAKWDHCTSANAVVDVMRRTLRASQKKARANRQVLELIEEAEQAELAGDLRNASQALRRVLRVRDRSDASTAHAGLELARIEALGRERLDSALSVADPLERYALLRPMREQFREFEEVYEPVQQHLGTIREEFPEECRDHDAQVALDEALAQLESGRYERAARSALRQLVRDYRGTPAAEEAARVLEQD